MSWIGAIIDAGADNKAATDAQNAGLQQQQTQRDLLNLQLALYNQGRQDNLGYQVTGNSALNQLAKMYGLSYYNAPVNTGNLTMSGGDVNVDRQSLGEWIADPGGFYYGQKSSTSPLQFGWSGGGTGSGQIVNGGGSSSQGTGQNDFSAFYDSPEYRTAYNEAMQGADRVAAATGRFSSGGHISDVARLGANIGNRYLGDYTSRLLTLAGFGPSAANSTASQGASFGAQAGNALTNIGNSAYNSAATASNLRSQGLSGLGNAFGQWANSWGQGNNATSGSGWDGSSAFGQWGSGWGGNSGGSSNDPYAGWY